jgi:putative transposase
MLKTELVYKTGFSTRKAAKRELFAYIEGYCNRQWLHSAVGTIMPERAE